MSNERRVSKIQVLKLMDMYFSIITAKDMILNVVAIQHLETR